MRLDDRMLKFLAGLLVISSGLQSCMSNAEDCVQNGSCPPDMTGAGGIGGIGGVGGDGVTTTSTACDSHSECGSCDRGELKYATAGTLCAGDQVCDGGGNCVACEDTTRPCPLGYECNGDKCGLVKGASCDDGVQCASGFCVDGHCCANECVGECRTCNSNTLFECKFTDAGYSHDPTCLVPGYACDGLGECDGQTNTPCTSDEECVSGNCTGPSNSQTCQPKPQN